MKIRNKYQFDETAIQNILQQLSSPKKICIIAPINPDGDTIGSSLAIGNLLSKINHEVTLLTLNRIIGLVEWMTGPIQVISFTDQSSLGKSIIQNSEFIFCLGFNSLSRIGPISEYLLLNHTATKILIDKSPAPENIFFDFSFSFPDACALAELIFFFSQKLKLTHLIDKSIADCIYSGIMTGSGNFKLNSVTPELHEIEAELLRKGANQKKWSEVSSCYCENDRKLKMPDCSIENFLERNNNAKNLSDAGHLF